MHMQITQSCDEIVHMCYAISGLATQSQDWNGISRLECNPRILRVCSTMLRLHKILRLRGTNRAQVPPLFLAQVQHEFHLQPGSCFAGMFSRQGM